MEYEVVENKVENEAKKTPSADKDGEVEIIGVTFRSAGKIYYFDANGIKASEGKHVIVDTARGYEYGKVALSNCMMPENKLVQPLRKVVKLADNNDDLRYKSNCEKEEEAFDICLKKIVEHGLEMKLIDVEYTFDNSKLLFYFTSEERVDFRELVKDLASVFRTRIELRQIGLRDETKIIGGFGVCGREFCCHSFLGDFVQVSIKMAKEQNLSLNSSKISGACGRLMCCLRYEYDTYQEELKKTPKVDSKVITPDGPGVVTDAQPLSGLVKVRLDRDPEGTPVVYDREALRSAEGELLEKASPIREKPTMQSEPVADLEEKPEKGDILQKSKNNRSGVQKKKKRTLENTAKPVKNIEVGKLKLKTPAKDTSAEEQPLLQDGESEKNESIRSAKVQKRRRKPQKYRKDAARGAHKPDKEE